jgi:TetR/AcrR family transcriptional repressor of nem operon
MQDREDTVKQILDTAQQMMQLRGYNAFSYADISAQVGITKAAIHYHFPNKSHLGREVVARYRAAFRQHLSQISESAAKPRQKLQMYAQLYASTLRESERMCLCGMLAADFLTLPEEVRNEVQGFFTDNEAWLAKVLEEGTKSGSIQMTDSVRETARLLVSGLEGAMLVARSFGDVARFEAVAQQLLDAVLA